MDWYQAPILLLLLLCLPLLWWTQRRSLHPMGETRKRALLAVRTLLIVLSFLALARPAMRWPTDSQAVLFIIDHSDSQGEARYQESFRQARQMAEALPTDTLVGLVSAGERPRVLVAPSQEPAWPETPPALEAKAGAHSSLAAAVRLSLGLVPPETSARLVLISDLLETRGSLSEAAQEAALEEVPIDVIAVAGPAQPDVRILQMRPNKSRLREGASVELTVEVESSVADEGLLHLYQNSIRVDSIPLKLEAGKPQSIRLERELPMRDFYRFRAQLEGFASDSLPGNDQATTFVDVHGRPRLLYIEGEPDEAHFLTEAMSREGIELEVRPALGIPDNIEQLSGYDGLIFSDVAAHQVTEESMEAIRTYVEELGGGFLMLGGPQSFGAGGYYRTPIEDILPVRMRSPDTEEQYATALCLVIDRSGSMGGEKIEICKSAAIETVEMLAPKDYLGVVTFDSNAYWTVPMTKASAKSSIKSRLANLNAGGGTNAEPGMMFGRDGLLSVKAKARHMIVLTDGQTGGGNYLQLASGMKQAGITISTVAVGQGADAALLRTIAAAGGGKFYQTIDIRTIPRIFTQDAMTHLGRLILEEPFKAQRVENHPMLKGWSEEQAPELLGYVKTQSKSTAQTPLVTDRGDPLLAHWRYGLGKVTAFTSDCKSRWASLWLASWSDGYGQFWAQILREMARPPQGRYMDMHLVQDGEEATIHVDLLADAFTFENEAEVKADIFHIPHVHAGNDLKQLEQVTLSQRGPGHYEASFSLDEPGVYFCRSQAGNRMVSAGLVHLPYSEASTGTVDKALAQKLSTLAGGRMLEEGASLKLEDATRSEGFVELRPWILRALLLLFVADLVIRRWENAMGLWESLASLLRRSRAG